MSGSVIPTDEQQPEVEETEEQQPVEEVEETGQQPGESQEDWERRFRGLQGGYQQAVERAQQLEQALFAQNAQQYAAQLQHLDPEIAQERWNNYMQGQQLTVAQQRLAAQMQQVDQGLKVYGATQLSQKYGVPLKDLMTFNDPDSMERAAQMAAQNRRARQGAERKAEKKDDFGSGGSNVSTKPKQKATNLREARQNFREAAKRLSSS